MSSSEMDLDYKIELFEEYYGDVDHVKKLMNECNICSSKLVLSHLSDYTNMVIKETARCPECGSNNRKFVHIIN
ncbi:MAG: hypothetical protein A2504_08945 [Bdellovibrionales bacterium RIFOXYD12_FULL_39_22]|nr:MAG: hypothetical protein A2385_13460 [Bdellovibrionales bacterium RIFOXYB1_FULL_39_21]OFZ40903.1 MAG: hypothetical protein A2485_16285 [Bdellovibrionales bacterium RIFOXYC12_FULL_39_17]OFZ44753.1 MAG: hypothetical protein A2404_10835 [Bdellovibrionales bacterium RIFOXYC1_FULL_39_130]OFZ73525.1 MAG: hypothetical protein A2451_16980 [Bdellovibrionales bacterium RIFOXYC2_FULL_39_8]OFZ74204.1 MAG: hypothetical protein A2560_03500 [Bdellovibrionales bacterium RIFOXYD1_FULL_39_84]OFZ92084.1 MAG: